MNQLLLSLAAGPKALPYEGDLLSSSALVVDGNPTSRTVLVAQLRDFGVGTVVQCARLADARRQLEYRKFDVVLCELEFDDKKSSGQELLDDLRRNQLLPFSTVFIMVTGEATYAKVAEAAESALDGYLLKPHSAGQLDERLRAARHRKQSLQAIFSAIEGEEFERAAQLCLDRFEARGEYWLYAARVGAELLLRTGKFTQAQTLYEAVVAAKTLPWAKLGVARSLLDAGHPVKAMHTLESLISEDPGYVDAYEVMGRAHLESGRMDKALESYRMASSLTPHSITRMQSLGMMLYYSGQRKDAEKTLDKAIRMGLDSKMFDAQVLVLVAFVRFHSNDRKGLQRCKDDMVRVRERFPGVARLQRLDAVLDVLVLLQNHQLAGALDTLRAMFTTVGEPDFDFEAASNLTTLLAQLRHRAIDLDEMQGTLEALAQRFCVSRPLTELLAHSAYAHEPFAEDIRQVHVNVLHLTEQAMSHSLKGRPRDTALALLELGERTRNSKIIDSAHAVLQRYGSRIEDAQELDERAQALRRAYARTIARPTLGEQRRQAGGLTLRVGAKQPT